MLTGMDTAASFSDRFVDLAARQATLDEERHAMIGEYLGSAMATFFSEHPEISEIRFTAYTPYFNDGDACEFSSNHQFPEFNGVNELNLGREDRAALQSAGDRFRELMRPLGDDDIKQMFGDHVEVIITPTGVTTAHCEHE